MDQVSFKTRSANENSVTKKWYVVDASGQSVGRLASKVAQRLRGKHKPDFTPHVDCGDNIIIINAEKANFTGNKWRDKEYRWYTGYPSGERSIRAKDLHRRDAPRIVEKAIKNMLPKNRLCRRIFRKNLFVYEGNEHKQAAQKPETLDIDAIK
ncbi:MAG: 50S ribosomal protein L13 [Flavobacteriales bacterium]